MKKAGLFLLYFLYIFNCSFVPLPYFLRTRVILGVVAAAFVVLANRFLTVRRDVLKVSIAFLLLFIPITITSLVNFRFDVWVTQYVILLFIHFIAAYFLVWISRSVDAEFSVNNLICYILAATVANSLIAISMFFSPPINNFLLAIQNFDDQSDMVIEEVLSLRLMGMGVGMFFMGGIIWGLALLFIAYLLRKHSMEGRSIWKLVCLFGFVLVVGTFIARTTLVGAGLAAAYICWPKRWDLTFSRASLHRIGAFFGLLLLFGVATVAVVNYRFPDLLDSAIVGWAFEMFISAGNDDAFTTQSTQHLETMFVWPDNFKTWLIGDALFNDEHGYYMGTDVGYLRLIYYFGLVGLSVFFGAQFFLFRKIAALYRQSSMTLLMIFMAVYVLALNIKGFADVNAFMFLLLWLAVLPKRTHIQRTDFLA